VVKPLLRSGLRSNYLPLGENGQLVFNSALQIREALRLRGLQAVADCLAIPQCHSEDGRIDWYAPRRGTVTPWASASISLRQQALDYLLQCRAEVEALRNLATKSENRTLQLLAMLLKHVLQFPSAQYIWLQNEKPIIAFWGFTDPSQPQAQHALDSLILSERKNTPPIQPLAELAPAVEVQEETPKPSPIEQEAILLTSEIATPLLRRRYSKRPIYYGLVIIFIVGIAVILHSSIYALPPIELKPIELSRVDIPHHAIKKLAEPQTIFTNKLPLQHATVIAKATPEVVPQATSVIENTLVMFPNSIKAGSIKFLNGTWQAQYTETEREKDKPPAMRVQISNGKGNVRISKDKQVCQATIEAGWLPSGTLSMRSKSRARCSDGTSQPVPDISCKSGTGDIALCHAQWGEGESASLTFKKVNG
jgi:hypothetical protein